MLFVLTICLVIGRTLPSLRKSWEEQARNHQNPIIYFFRLVYEHVKAFTHVPFYMAFYTKFEAMQGMLEIIAHCSLLHETRKYSYVRSLYVVYQVISFNMKCNLLLQKCL